MDLEDCPEGFITENGNGVLNSVRVVLLFSKAFEIEI